jgi:hypothetical protein
MNSGHLPSEHRLECLIRICDDLILGNRSANVDGLFYFLQRRQMDQVHEELYLRLRLGSNSQSSAKGIKQEQDKTGANTKISRQMGAGSYR